MEHVGRGELTEDFVGQRRARRRGLWGDIAVRRTAKRSPKKQRHKDSLWSHGMRKSGDVAYGFVAERTFVGALLAHNPNEYEVFPLTAESARACRELHLPVVRRSGDGAMTSVETYETHDGLQARRVDLSNGEFIELFQAERHFSIVWSSALPLATHLSRVMVPLFEAASFGEGVAVVNDTLVEGSWRYVLSACLNPEADIDYVRFDAASFAVSWRADIGRESHGKIKLHECAVVATVVDREFIEGLLLESATEHVGGDAGVLKEFAELTEVYPTGRALT